jgi:hypothetical protein
MAFLIKVCLLFVFRRLILFYYRATWCNGNIMDLNSGVARVDPHAEHWGQWLQTFLVFLSPSSQILGLYLNCVASASFKILSFSSFYSHPTMDRLKYW